MADKKNINDLLEIMAKLRDPKDGCPWDLEQDFKSITPHTIEEAYEVADAIEKNNMDELSEELGDLLLQVVFYAQMAKEQNIFNFEIVVNKICQKLIFRHPHVFGNETISSAKEQEESWEKLKAQEKPKESAIDGIAKALPALMRSEKIQKKAAKTGFDWPHANDVFAKIDEEILEVQEVLNKEPENKEHLEEEIGDLLFAVSNLARKLEIKPEQALKKANDKFSHRFKLVEKQAKDLKQNLNTMSLDELNELWDKAKVM